MNTARHIKITSDPTMPELVGLVVEVSHWDYDDCIVRLPDGATRIVFNGEWEHIEGGNACALTRI